MTVGTTTRSSRADQLSEARHPVFNDRRLRLGTFSSNLSGGCAISTIDDVLEAAWDQTLALARMGDEMEFEALVPVGRWRGFGGESVVGAAPTSAASSCTAPVCPLTDSTLAPPPPLGVPVWSIE